MLLFVFIATFLSGISGASMTCRKSKTAFFGCSIAYTIAGEVILSAVIPTSVTYQSIILDTIIAMIAAILYFDDSKRDFLLHLAADANCCLVIPILVSSGIDAAYAKRIRDYPTLIASGLIYSMGGEWLFAFFFPVVYSASSLALNLIIAIAYASFLVDTGSNCAKIFLILIECIVFAIQKHLNIMPPKIYFDKAIVVLRQYFFTEKYVLAPQNLKIKTAVYFTAYNYIRQTHIPSIGIKKLSFHRKLM